MVGEFVVAMVTALAHKCRMVACCIFYEIRCVMFDICHAEREYPQDGGCGKKVDSLYC